MTTIGEDATARPDGRRVPGALPLLHHRSPGGTEAARRERRDAAANRQRILATARSLFAAQGVDVVSMNEIARAAGIGPATLYRRYAHKGLLCAALLEENMGRLHRDVQAGLKPDAPAEPALAQLAFVLTRLVAFNEENGPLLGAMADAACGDRRNVVYSGPFYGWLHQTVGTLLGRAVATRECPSLDVAWFADALLAPLAIDLYLFQRHERGFTPERLIAAVRQLLDRLKAGAAATGVPGVG